MRASLAVFPIKTAQITTFSRLLGPLTRYTLFSRVIPRLTAVTRNTPTLIRNMSHSPHNAHVDSIENLDQGNWIQTRKINYTDPAGRARVWEMAVRTTRTETTGLDAVSILGLLRDDRSPKKVVLVKQFRPPCSSVVIELPAGLIDPNELVESTAVRELLEETGYHGTFVLLNHTDLTIYSDPGLTNANMALVTVDIDLAHENNQNPQPQLEDGEFIEVFTLPLSELLDGLVKVCQEQDCVVDARLYHLAVGLKLASQIQA